MSGFHVGDWVRLKDDGFGRPDDWTERAGLLPNTAYLIEAITTDGFIKLRGIPAAKPKYGGWASMRFVLTDPPNMGLTEEDRIEGLVAMVSNLLAAERKRTAKAVIDRVSEMWTGDERIWDIAREFEVES